MDSRQVLEAMHGLDGPEMGLPELDERINGLSELIGIMHVIQQTLIDRRVMLVREGLAAAATGALVEAGTPPEVPGLVAASP